MKLPAALAALLGLAVMIALIVAHGAGAIGQALATAGWGILLVIALHLPQVAASALGWRATVVAPRAPSAPVMFGLRLIREAINALLPVAQIGGDIVGARLLSFAGVSLGAAAGSVAVDFSLEVLGQALFTLLGLGLLLAGPGAKRLPLWAAAGVIVALGGFAVVFMCAQRMGMFRLLERALLRLAERKTWRGLQDIAGLHLAILAAYKSPRRLLLGFGFHLISWLLGGLEVLAAFYVLDIPAGLRDALIVESLGQAGRAAGFAVPGALGVQEAGIVLVCGLIGIGPQAALEVSLIKRIRELALGVPGLLAWTGIEWLHTAASAEPAS